MEYENILNIKEPLFLQFNKCKQSVKWDFWKLVYWKKLCQVNLEVNIYLRTELAADFCYFIPLLLIRIF